MIVALICFFPIVINTLDGLRSVDPEAIKMMRSLDASHPEIASDIGARKLITPETEKALRQAIEAFSQGWQG